MNVSNLFTDDDAVSPVIGVILMVAITVILAAVIGAFVLNIGGSQDTAPQATINFENRSDGIKMTMQSGGTLDGDNIEVQVAHVGTTKSVYLSDSSPDISEMVSGDTLWVTNDSDADAAVAWGKTNDDLSPTGDKGEFYSGTEVQFVWHSPSSGDTSVIASYETS